MTADLGEAENFLDEVKEVIENNPDNWFSLKPTKKNQETLDVHGLTTKDMKRCIKEELEPKDYLEGPKECKDHSSHGHTIWVFGRKYLSIRFYIKLEIVNDPFENLTAINCLSFHEEEYRDDFPYK